MTDPERELWLRKLRFPEEMERAFQSDYFRKSITFFRLGHLVALLLTGVLFALAFLRGVPPALLLWVHIPIVASLCAMIAFSFHRRFESVWQPASAVVASLVCVYIIYLAATLSFETIQWPASGFPLWFLLLHQCSLLVATFVLTRLNFRWLATAIALQLAGAAAIIFLTTSTPAALVVQAEVVFMIPVTTYLLLSAYTLEWYRRSEFLTNRLLAAERDKSERLLLNILPEPVAARLRENHEAIADSYAEVTVLFADIVDFTILSARLSAPELVQLLNRIFSCFDALTDKHGLEKIKTIGDAYMVVGGLPNRHPDHVMSVAEMALDMQEAIAGFVQEAGKPLRLRIGINTGPVVAGVIGTKKYIYDLWGDTVNMASRMESHGSAGMIQVTEAVVSSLRDRMNFGAPRRVDVKGRGMMTTYELVGRKQVDTA